MKYSPEELNKVLEEAPKNEKGQAILSDEDFMDNIRQLPKGTRSDTGKTCKDGGYIQAPKKGSERARMIASNAGKKAQEINAKRRTMAETIDIFLKKTDKNGVSNQDKIIMGMIAKAMDGCVGASEFLRDTVGEKPSDNLNLEVMTEADRELVANLQARLNELKGTKG